MKKFGLLILLLVSLSSCNNNKALDDLIVQNNKHYEIELEEYKLNLEEEAADMPIRFDKDYFNEIDSCFKSIKNLKTQVEYKTTLQKIKELGYSIKIGKSIKEIQSDNLVVLKNNLYVNLLLVVHRKKAITALSETTHCILGSNFIKVVKKNYRDSIFVDFYTDNDYQVNVDNVTDGDDYLGWKSVHEHKIWSIKYKPKSKNAHSKGRIFLRDPWYYKMIMVEEFDDKNALDKNPFEN